MKNDFFVFQRFTREEIQGYTANRIGEMKLGNKVTSEVSTKTRFLVLGIEESIGPQANGGHKGSEHAFQAFLNYFLNMQSNRFFVGEEICFVGRIRQREQTITSIKPTDIVSQLDQLVFEVLSKYLQNHLVLIVIGGGHNNAYPILKSLHHHFNESLAVINLDPHSDCRPLEGRHSGNPFSYAIHERLLHAYHVLGLHRAYNNETSLVFMDMHKCNYSFYDDILSGTTSLEKVLNHSISQLNAEKRVGIELDMDAIRFSPSSAFTPSGISTEDARKYVITCSRALNPMYLHLTEAAPKNDFEIKISGKLLSYLTYDFLINHPKTSKN